MSKPNDNYYIKAQYNIASKYHPSYNASNAYLITWYIMCCMILSILRQLIFFFLEYEKLTAMPWDDLYVRSQLDRPAENEGELGFQKGDILCVDSTLYNGHMGMWRAWLVDDDGKKVCGGAIPSKSRLEEELVLKRSLSEADDELKGSRRGSASARRSFFRRKNKHQRNNSKDSREFNSFSDASINSDSVPYLAGTNFYHVADSVHVFKYNNDVHKYSRISRIFDHRSLQEF